MCTTRSAARKKRVFKAITKSVNKREHPAVLWKQAEPGLGPGLDIEVID